MQCPSVVHASRTIRQEEEAGTPTRHRLLLRHLRIRLNECRLFTLLLLLFLCLHSYSTSSASTTSRNLALPLVAANVLSASTSSGSCLISVTDDDGSTVSMVCSNHGTCESATQTCICNSGYTGAFCDVYAECIEDDDCFQGSCDQSSGRCQCDDGWFGVHCMLAGAEANLTAVATDSVASTDTTDSASDATSVSNTTDEAENATLDDATVSDTTAINTTAVALAAWQQYDPLQLVESTNSTLVHRQVQMLYTSEMLEDLIDGALVTQLSLRYTYFPLPVVVSDDDTLEWSNLQIRFALLNRTDYASSFANDSDFLASGVDGVSFLTAFASQSLTQVSALARVSRAHFGDTVLSDAYGDPLTSMIGQSIFNHPDGSTALDVGTTVLPTSFGSLTSAAGWINVYLPTASYFQWSTDYIICVDVQSDGVVVVTDDDAEADEMESVSLASATTSSSVSGSFDAGACGDGSSLCMLASVGLDDSMTRAALPLLLPLRLGRNSLTSPPLIQSVSPTGGVAVGGKKVNLTGTNFPTSVTDAWTVALFTRAYTCTNVSFVGLNSSLSCRVPTRSTSDVATFPTQVPYFFRLQALSSGLMASTSLSSASYTYYPPPIVYDVSPTTGGPGTRVQLIGAFLGTSASDLLSVAIGNISCASLEYSSSTLVTCTVGTPASYSAQVAAATSAGDGDATADLLGTDEILSVVVVTGTGGSSTQNDATTTSTTTTTTKYFTFQTPPILRVSLKYGNATMCAAGLGRCRSLYQAVSIYGQAGATFLLGDGVYDESSASIPIGYPQMTIQSLSDDPVAARITCAVTGCFTYAVDTSTTTSTAYFFPSMLAGIGFESVSLDQAASNATTTAGAGVLFDLALANGLESSSSTCAVSGLGDDLATAIETVQAMVDQNMAALTAVTTDTATTTLTSTTSSTPMLFNHCVFAGVTSTTGPAVLITGSNVVFLSCAFLANTNSYATSSGGASAGGLGIGGVSSVVLQGCSFVSNTGGDGGGVSIVSSSTVAILNTTFTENTASRTGGAVLVTGGSLVAINSCNFTANLAGSAGGAIEVEKSSLVVSESTFARNLVGLPSDDLLLAIVLPTASLLGGGAIRGVVSNIGLKQCVFDRNVAGWPGIASGGAIDLTYSTLTVRDSTFRSNLAARGGAISAATLSSLDISRCTFDWNVAGFAAEQLRVGVVLNRVLNVSLDLASPLAADASTWGQGGALYWAGFVASLLDATSFHGNLANDGGAVYLDRASGGTSTSATQVPSSVLGMTNVSFTHNRATGRNMTALALALLSNDGLVNATITSIDIASPPVVNGGGALVAVSSAFSCVGCVFESNCAPLGGGGALLWQDDWALQVVGWRAIGVTSSSKLDTFFPASITMPTNSTEWSANSALYGSDFATVPSRVRSALRETSEPWRIFPLSTSFLDENELIGAVLGLQSSGLAFSPTLAVELLDAYNQRVCTSESSTSGLRARVVATALANEDVLYDSAGKAVTASLAPIGTTEVAFTLGLANFTDLGLLALPGSNASLAFVTLLHSGQLITTATSFAVGITDTGEALESSASLVTVGLRACEPGEYIDVSSTRCATCATGTTSTYENALECTTQQVAVSRSQTYALIFFFAALAVLELAALVGVIVYRKHRVIFSASPLFCGVILVGSMLCLLAAMLMVEQPIATSSATCFASVWLLNIGFQLCFGAMVSKTYRLYRIFDNALFAPVAISNRQLCTMLLGLVMFDAVILTVWQGVWPPYLEVDEYRQCFSDESTIFSWLLIGTKAALILYGAWLTYRVRNIPTNYNQSRFLAAALFTVAFLSFVVLSLQWGFGNGLTVPTLTTIQSVGVALGAFLSAAFIFVPHFLNIWLDKSARRKSHAFRQMKAELKSTRQKASGGGGPISTSSRSPHGGSFSVSSRSGGGGLIGPGGAPSPPHLDQESSSFKHTDVVVDAADYLMPPLPIPGVISHLIKQFSQKQKRHPLEHQFVLLSSELGAATRAEALSLKRLSENRKEIVEHLRKLSQLHFEIEFRKRVRGGLDEREERVYEDETNGGNGNAAAAAAARNKDAVSGVRARPAMPQARRPASVGASTGTSTATTAGNTTTNTPRASMIRGGTYDSLLIQDALVMPSGTRDRTDSTGGESGMVPIARDRRGSSGAGGGTSSNPLSLAGTPDRTPHASRRPSQIEMLSTIRDDVEALSPTPNVEDETQQQRQLHSYAEAVKDTALAGDEQPPKSRDSTPDTDESTASASDVTTGLVPSTNDKVPMPSLSPPPPPSASALLTPTSLASPSTSLSSPPSASFVRGPPVADVENPSAAIIAMHRLRKERAKPPLPPKMRPASATLPRGFSPVTHILSPTGSAAPSNPAVAAALVTPHSSSPPMAHSPLSPPARSAATSTPSAPRRASASSATDAGVRYARSASTAMLAPHLRIHPLPTRDGADSGSSSSSRVALVADISDGFLAAPAGGSANTSAGSTPVASPDASPIHSPSQLSRRLPHGATRPSAQETAPFVARRPDRT